MWRNLLRIIAIAAFLPAALAMAGEVPAPVKKPRDKSGAADTRPEPATSTAKEMHHQVPSVPAGAIATVDGPKSNESKSELEKPGNITTGAVKSKTNSKAPSNKVPEPAKGQAKVETGKADTKSKIPVEPTGKTTPAAPAAVPPPAPPVEWTGAEIEAAKNHCAAILKDIDAVVLPEPPKREGACGAPAPYRLISIGKSPQVSLDPPALLTCDMVVALAKWIKQDLQPLAKKHLGSDLIKIETMSDYSCRAAYGRAGNKWSEHAYANALDIRGFVTATAERAYVLESWGPTVRDVEAVRLAAAKAAAEKVAAAKAAAEKNVAAKALAEKEKTGPSKDDATPQPAPQGTQTATSATPNTATTSSTAESKPSLLKSTITPLPDPAKTGLGFQQPSRLGGPKDKDKDKDKNKLSDDAPTLGPKGRMAKFLHEAHASACKIFGTTLGPEANNDHRNHFHVDMAPRKATKICD